MLRSLAAILKKTVYKFFDDGCPSLAAALAYYTVFSLPPFLMIIVNLAGPIFGTEAMRNRVHLRFATMIGPRAADQMSQALSAIQRFGSSADVGPAMLVGSIALAFSATAAFAQLQRSLNQVWGVRPNPRQSEIKTFFIKRLVSFGIILASGFLLLAFLVASAVLAIFADYVNLLLPAGLARPLFQLSTTLLPFVVFAALFAAMYKALPDAEVAWKDVAIGGIITALLFIGGKFLISVYLRKSNIASIYGAAGSLAMILLWTYFAAMAVLLGAEFTQVWAERSGVHVRPKPGAVIIRHKGVAAR
jgi:membrane protein